VVDQGIVGDSLSLIEVVGLLLFLLALVLAVMARFSRK